MGRRAGGLDSMATNPQYVARLELTIGAPVQDRGLRSEAFPVESSVESCHSLPIQDRWLKSGALPNHVFSRFALFTEVDDFLFTRVVIIFSACVISIVATCRFFILQKLETPLLRKNHRRQPRSPIGGCLEKRVNWVRLPDMQSIDY